MGGISLVVVVATLIASNSGDTTDPTTEAPAEPAALPTTAPALATAPITGRTYEVSMIGDTTNRFEPGEITINVGDGVTFMYGSGGPHNVVFDPKTIPDGAADQLDANISNRVMPLQSGPVSSSGESVTVSFAGVPTGSYFYRCTEHAFMRGSIVVQ